jgi:hypothetical protein
MEPVTGNHPIHGHYTPGGWTAFFVVLVVVWTLAWSLLSWLAPGNDPKRMLKDVPFSMLRGGQMIGLMLGLSVVIGYIGIWWHQAIWATLDGIGAMLLLALTAPLINKVAGRTGGGLNLKRGEARTTAVVTSLLYVADGFAIRGVLPGPGSTGHDIWVGLVFYVLVVAFITVIYSLMAAPRFFSEYSIREPGADSARSCRRCRTPRSVRLPNGDVPQHHREGPAGADHHHGECRDFGGALRQQPGAVSTLSL